MKVSLSTFRQSGGLDISSQRIEQIERIGSLLKLFGGINKLVMEDLTIGSRTIDGILVVDLNGDLDAFTVQEVKKHLVKLMEQGYRKIVVNFSKVGYINSTSIGVLAGRLRDIKSLKGDMVLAELSDRVNRILTLVGGKRLFNIFDTEQEAVSNLA